MEHDKIVLIKISNIRTGHGTSEIAGSNLVKASQNRGNKRKPTPTRFGSGLDFLQLIMFCEESVCSPFDTAYKVEGKMHPLLDNEKIYKLYTDKI